MDVDEQGRDDIIAQFTDICAVNDEKAIEFLSHCDFNLEQAVQLYFQTGGALDNTMEALQNERNSQQELRRRNVHRENAPPPANRANVVAERQMSWVEWFWAIASLPVKIVVSAFFDIFNSFTSIFGVGGGPVEVTDAPGDVRRFIHYYEQEIAPRAAAPVTFFDGSYQEAVRRAREGPGVLAVFLHDRTRAASVLFLQDAISSLDVYRVLDREGVIIWGAACDTPEGLRVSRALHVHSYPHLGLMIQKGSGMTQALKMTTGSASTVAMNLNVAMASIRDHLSRIQAQRLQREEDNRIRAEQESEYQLSLAADRKKKEEREKKQREEEEAKERVKREEERIRVCKEELERRKEELRGKNRPNCEGETLRIQVRFPSGQKTECAFDMDETLEVLFNEVLVHPSCPDFFSLFTNFPRRQLHAAPSWYHDWRTRCAPEAPPTNALRPTPSTFRAEGLSKSLVVMVQDDNA